MRSPKEPAFTRHAQARMQQRAIRADALDRLLEFGREAFDHHGAVILYFDKAARHPSGHSRDATQALLDPLTAAP